MLIFTANILAKKNVWGKFKESNLGKSNQQNTLSWKEQYYPITHQPRKIAKHSQTTHRLLATNCLSVYDHFVTLSLKDLKQRNMAIDMKRYILSNQNSREIIKSFLLYLEFQNKCRWFLMNISTLIKFPPAQRM